MNSSSLTLGIVVLLVVPVIIMPIDAQSGNGLYWGVNVGDEIKYVLQRKIIDESFAPFLSDFAPFITKVDAGQTIISRVDYLPPIPQEGNESAFFLRANCTLLRENDSEVLTENFQMTVIPIGNWSISMDDFFSQGRYQPENETTPTGEPPMAFSLVNTTDTWGTMMSGEFWFSIIVISFNMEMIYFKANGTLSKLLFQVSVAGSTTFDVLFVQWRPDIATIVPPEPSLIPYLIVGAIVTPIALVILYFVYRRRKRKRAVE